MSLPLFLIPVLVGLAAQSLKPLLNKQWYAQLGEGGKKIPRYGGMPSAHTAFAFSLATLIAWTDGVMSTSFAIAASIVIYVLDDALRMRIFLSRHGQALDLLVKKLPVKQQEDFPYLETRLGHKGREVTAGAVLGTVLTLVVLWLLSPV